MRIPKPWFQEQNQTWHVWLDGKQHNLGKNKTKAQETYRELMQARRPSGSMTARQAIDAYWNWLKKNRAAETAGSRDRLLKSIGESVPETLKATNVRPFHVRAWIDANSKVKVVRSSHKGPRTGQTEAQETDRNISPTTANYRIALIVTVFSWAKSMGYIDENPPTKTSKPKRKVWQEFVPADLWPQVLELSTEQECIDFLTVMLSTGDCATLIL